MWRKRIPDHKQRACRHCGSPAKGNPCWRGITIKNWVGDAPCILYEGLEYSDIGRESEADEFMCQSKSALQIIPAIAIPVAIVIGAAYLAR